MDEKIGYITLEEANAYISSHFLKSDETRINWEALDDDDKCALLRQSLEDIENLTYYGYKTDQKQELSFPRNGSNTVPNDVNAAQIVGATERLSSNDGYSAYMSGISKESLGTASYEYNTKTNIYDSGCRPGAYKLLKKYIKTVFSFC